MAPDISLCGIIRFSVPSLSTVQCSHQQKYKVEHLYDNCKGIICLQCGTHDACCLFVHVDYCVSALLDDQSCTPLAYKDSYGYLPPVIHNQINMLCDLLPDVSVKLDAHIRHCTSILVGSIRSNGTIITVSFLTPTLNNGTWMCTSRGIHPRDLLVIVTNKCNEFRPYSCDELKIMCGPVEFNCVIISGKLSHIYASLADFPCNVNVRSQSVSIGSCTLRVQIIRVVHTVPLIDDVSINGGIVSNLSNDNNESAVIIRVVSSLYQPLITDHMVHD